MDWPWVRLGRMLQSLTSGGLGLSLYDSQLDTQHPVSRPMLGGATSGFHTVPRVGDQVAVIHQQHGDPVGMISVADLQSSGFTPLPVLNPGESASYHNDGRIFGKLLNSGSTTLWSGNAGANTITLDFKGRPRYAQTANPTLTGSAANLGAGFAKVLTAGSTDLAGSFSYTTDPTTVGPGTAMGALLFAASFGVAPRGVLFTALNGVSGPVVPFATSVGTSSFAINFTYTPAPNTTYSFSYEVIP